MKNLIMILFLVEIFLCAFAHAQNFVPVKEAKPVHIKMLEASKKIETIQCSFTQEKNTSLLSEKVVSNGKFYFKRDNKVRLEYLQPTPNTIVINDSKVFVTNGKKSTLMDMHRNRVFQQLNNIITGSINGSLFTSKDFTTQLFENTSSVKAELKPISKTLKKFISSIVITFAKTDFTATRIEMNETSGDNTILSFSNKELNRSVADSLFSYQ